MKLGVLFSGGKDSCAALRLAQEYGHEVVCLLTMASENPDSYMFHTPNIDCTELQAKAIGIPLVTQRTKGIKEKELEDLKKLIQAGMDEHGITGIVTGAIESVYQATRVQHICNELGLWCFNPLWKRNQHEHMKWLLLNGFDVYISGIAAFPLDEAWLGRKLDVKLFEELLRLEKQVDLSVAGEGGEFETFVANGPGWSSRVDVEDAETHYDNHAGQWRIIKARIVMNTEQPETKTDAPIITQRIADPKQLKGKVLVISMCMRPFSELEFVKPILRAFGKDALAVRLEALNNEILENCRMIVLSGTALMDDHYLRRLNEFKWLRDLEKPVIGICAGMQVLSIIHGGKLEDALEIGMTTINGEQPLPKKFEAYALHRHTVEIPYGYDAIAHSAVCVQAFKRNDHYGLLFHPEVRNPEILRRLFENITESKTESSIDFSKYF